MLFAEARIGLGFLPDVHMLMQLVPAILKGQPEEPAGQVHASHSG